MESLFNEQAYQEIIARIDSLSENSQRNWGKMTVGQMAWHCQVPLKIAVKNKTNNAKGNLLLRLFFKKSLYNDRPWRKGLPTASLAKAKEDKDFEQERKKLKALVEEVHLLRNRQEWNPHPLFGPLTHEQWGKLQYKHLDHHLRQFGV